MCWVSPIKVILVPLSSSDWNATTYQQPKPDLHRDTTHAQRADLMLLVTEALFSQPLPEVLQRMLPKALGLGNRSAALFFMADEIPEKKDHHSLCHASVSNPATAWDPKDSIVETPFPSLTCYSKKASGMYLLVCWDDGLSY